MSAKRKVRATLDRHSYTDSKGRSIACYVLPADAESYDAMVEQGARAVFPFIEMEWDTISVWDSARDIAKAQLAAIGITRPKK